MQVSVRRFEEAAERLIDQGRERGGEIGTVGRAVNVAASLR